MTFDLHTGRDDDDRNLWTWQDGEATDPGTPRLVYRQPSATEYNDYDREWAKYQDRMQAHIDDREGEVEGWMEEFDDLEELDDDERAELRWILLLSGFRPTHQEIEAFVDFCVTCTIKVENMSWQGSSLDWSDGEGLVEALPPDTPEACRNRIVESLGKTPEQRIASIIGYSRAIARGLPEETKKN